MRAAPLAAVLLIALATVDARGDVDGDQYTSAEYGVRAEVPRGWRISEVSGYPGVLLQMSRSTPPARLFLTIDPIVPGCRTERDAVFCSPDPSVAIAQLRERLDAAGFRVTTQQQSRTPELVYEARGRFVRHALVVVGDQVVSVILATETVGARAGLRRTYDRVVQSIRATAP